MTAAYLDQQMHRNRFAGSALHIFVVVVVVTEVLKIGFLFLPGFFNINLTLEILCRIFKLIGVG